MRFGRYRPRSGAAWPGTITAHPDATLGETPDPGDYVPQHYDELGADGHYHIHGTDAVIRPYRFVTAAAGSHTTTGTNATLTYVTNLASNPRSLNNASWTKQNVTVTADQTADPNGDVTADLITVSAGNAQHDIFSATVTVAANTAVTFAWYVKKGTHRYVYVNAVWNGQTTRWANAYFDLDGGGTSASQEAVGTNVTIAATGMLAVANGFFRLTMRATCSDTANPNVALAFVGAASGHSPGNFGGTTYNAAGTETVYAWNGQAGIASSS